MTFGMNNLNLAKQLLMPLLLFSNIFLIGCPLGDKFIAPTIVNGTSGAFTIDPVNIEDCIESLVLYDGHSGNVVWEIIAIKPVRAEGFPIQIGVVPDGFRLLIPEDKKSFIPDADKGYMMVITTDNIKEKFLYIRVVREWGKNSIDLVNAVPGTSITGPPDPSTTVADISVDIIKDVMAQDDPPQKHKEE